MGMEMEVETLEHHDSVGFQMSCWNLWYLLEIDDEWWMLAYDFSLFRVLDQELAGKSTNLLYYIFFIFYFFSESNIWNQISDEINKICLVTFRRLE